MDLAKPRKGHLGMGHANVVATSITFIDPKRPECR
jgi:hypothetical protein